MVSYMIIRQEAPDWAAVPAVTLSHQPWLAP